MKNAGILVETCGAIACISFFKRDFLTYILPVESPVNTLIALAEKPASRKQSSLKSISDKCGSSDLKVFMTPS